MTRKTPTVDRVVQAGGIGGDDEGSLAAVAKQVTAASEAQKASASAAPYRVAVMLRLLRGLPSSGPMRVVAAFSTWRLITSRRQALVHGARHHADVAVYKRREAEVRSLVDEVKLAEEAASAAAASLLHKVVAERGRQLAEGELRKSTMPLALQGEANKMKEALQLEVIARQAAEAKATERSGRARRWTASCGSRMRPPQGCSVRRERVVRPPAGAGASGRQHAQTAQRARQRDLGRGAALQVA